MFTGLVEEVGTLQGVHRGSNSAILTIGARTVLEGTKVGDSIMTNGVCLTVTELGATYFSADVMHETLRRSSLGDLSPGSPVNLERAMPADGRFGGHMVSGHIDGTGTVTELRQDDNAVWYTISAAPELLRYIVEKGSICIDGISLTVAAVDDRVTNLSTKGVGSTVNLECDVIGKYAEKLLGPFGTAGGTSPQEEKTSGITEAFLREYGF